MEHGGGPPRPLGEATAPQHRSPTGQRRARTPPSRGVRNVMFDEDRSQVRCSNIPHMMAALRNTTIGLLRWAAISTLQQLVAGWLPNQYKRWFSSVLNSKTEWPCVGREESVWRLCNAVS